MTKQQAERLAAFDKSYRARNLRGQWVVWCDASDHVVEFAPVCRWFLLCDNPATTTVPHSILGDVPCCERCAKRARGEDVLT